MRGRWLILPLALAMGLAEAAEAAEPRKVKVGVLKLSSSAPVFIGCNGTGMAGTVAMPWTISIW